MIGTCAVMGDEDGYRTCADHRLRHTPEYNPLQTRLSVCTHHHEVVLSILCLVVDALGGSAVIREHVDVYRARHFPSRQTVKCAEGIRAVSRERIGVDIEEAQPSPNPHRDGDGELEGLDGGLREVDGNQEASEQHAVMLPQKKTPRDPRVEGGGCYPWVEGNAGERRIPPERSRGGLRMRRGLESLPPDPQP